MTRYEFPITVIFTAASLEQAKEQALDFRVSVENNPFQNLMLHTQLEKLRERPSSDVEIETVLLPDGTRLRTDRPFGLEELETMRRDGLCP